MRLETIRRLFWPTLRGNQFEYPLFWQLKIQSSNDIHSAGILILYGNTIYSVRGILFNCINPDRITLQQMFFSTIWDISLRSNRRPFLIYVLLVKDWQRGRYSLALIPFRSTPILKKLTGSLSQDFRWRDHVNRAFLSRPHASAVQEALG